MIRKMSVLDALYYAFLQFELRAQPTCEMTAMECRALDDGSRQNMAVLLRDLCEKGLVIRRDDKRPYLYSITPEGRKALASWKAGTYPQKKVRGILNDNMQKRRVLGEAFRRHKISSYRVLSETLLKRAEANTNSPQIMRNLSSLTQHFYELEADKVTWWKRSGEWVYGLTRHLCDLLPDFAAWFKEQKATTPNRPLRKPVHQDPSYQKLSARFMERIARLKSNCRGMKKELQKTRREALAAKRRLRRIANVIRLKVAW